MHVHTRIGTSGDCGHFCIPFTQYSPLATEALQSVVSCCLTSLQDIALSGDNLRNIIRDDKSFNY